MSLMTSGWATNGLKVQLSAEEALVLADRLRRRSEIEGGLPGLVRLAEKYEAQGMALLGGRAAGGDQLPSAANNDNTRTARQAQA